METLDIFLNSILIISEARKINFIILFISDELTCLSGFLP